MEPVVVNKSFVPLLKSIQSWSKSTTGNAVSPVLFDTVLHTGVTSTPNPMPKQINVCHFGTEIRTDTCLTSLIRPQWRS